MKKVHLGCGSNILNGWINLDLIDHPKIIKHDLRNPLPFDNNSIDFFFSEHFFEHLNRNEGLKILKEIYRCLKSGGVSRTTVPDLDYAINAYNKDNLSAFNATKWRPKNKCDLINGIMRNWSHKYIYNKEDLLLIHKECNFNKSYIQDHRKSSFPQLNNLEIRDFSCEIICEAIK